MVFSSFVFLSLFMPIVFLIYPLLTTAGQNIFLLVASIFFYWWGQPDYLWIMLLSIVATHIACGRIASAESPAIRKLHAALGIGINLGFLIYFKYAMFILDSVPGHWIQDSRLADFSVVLPLGISFYVFQAISYIIDVYRGGAPGDMVGSALYISMFPQLVAGPILRFSTVQENLHNRVVSMKGYVEGLSRFCYGLGKKILLANPMGEMADRIFETQGDLTCPLAWLGVASYTLQIYYDFSGYSDMAIGMGRALGFTFPDNFNYPYVASSVTEFWRRWHISLSTWFRDYLYIPLGGNRRGHWRTNCNLFLVFAVTGLWHGAEWSFMVWGLWHGIFLMAEKRYAKRFVAIPAVVRWGFTMVIVMCGWVFFRAENCGAALAFLSAMFNPFLLGTNVGTIFDLDIDVLRLLDGKFVTVFAAACFLAAGKCPLSRLPILGPCLALVVLVWSYITMINSGFNPFIYFRF